MPSPQEITTLLMNWSNGDRAALDQLLPFVYDELRRLAHHYIRQEHSGHTLQTTALVHEAYARLADYRNTPCRAQAHFFALAAEAMRRILVDHARGLQRAKRGGGAIKVALNEQTLISPARTVELLILEEALTRLEAIDPRKSRVVEMRCFVGLNNAEIAEALDISANTVMRDWNFAEAWLRREIGPSRV
jgi:RNA polymerase sigma factor (TIGR02999 family)